jgi:glycosyltransferase involved in cell wall biosynthesis
MKLSIITVNKNNARGLQKTIQSVMAQNFSGFEFIIIDGASTDGSVDIIKKYAGRISYWISEPDAGIYNAMNKGIKKARGDYCLFLNSGDMLITQTTLNDIQYKIDGTADIYYSNTVFNDGETAPYPQDLEISTLLKYPPNHQNSLIRRILFQKHGFYNENFLIVSDWEFLLFEKLKYKSIFKHIGTNIAVYDNTGISSDINLRRKEQFIMYNNVFGEFSGIVKFYFNINKSVYMDIITNYGGTKFLDFILRAYRFILRRLLHRGKKKL